MHLSRTRSILHLNRVAKALPRHAEIESISTIVSSSHLSDGEIDVTGSFEIQESATWIRAT
jgi:hypothetical protein